MLTLLCTRTEHEDRNPSELSALANVFDKFEPVHMRHLQIGNDRGKPGSLASCAPKDFECLSGVFRSRHLHSPSSEHLNQNDSICLVVIDDENRSVRQDFGVRVERSWLGRCWFESNRKMKRTAHTRFAFQPQLPAHQIYETFCNRQSKSGPAILSRGGTIGLGKCPKDHVLFLFYDSDSRVAHAEMNHSACLGRLRTALDFDDYFAALREFHGIPHQVDEHLSYSAGITRQIIRHIGSDSPRQFQSFLMGSETERLQCVSYALTQRKVRNIQIQFSCFNLGEIENVVDQAQQGSC